MKLYLFTSPYLRTETIFVPHQGLELPDLLNLRCTRFIRASFGPPLNDPNLPLHQTCYITFGSGNPCALEEIVSLAAKVFPFVLVGMGRISPLKHVPRNVSCVSFVASSSLTGRVAAVISHGGVGTVGTFAESGTPHLIIPTELDQSVTALYAARFGIARYFGLGDHAARTCLGRQLPRLDTKELLEALEWLRFSAASPRRVVSEGASDIAESICRMLPQVSRELARMYA